jgi:hypothetical protein
MEQNTPESAFPWRTVAFAAGEFILGAAGIGLGFEAFTHAGRDRLAFGLGAITTTAAALGVDKVRRNTAPTLEAVEAIEAPAA